MAEPSPNEVTQLLAAIRGGEDRAVERLWPMVYEELRELARAKMARERPGQTLQPTALVHEAYLRLLGPHDSDSDWQNRAHFFGAAATAMRRILIERARRQARLRHGGAGRRTPMSEVVLVASDQPVDLLDLDRAFAEARGDRRSEGGDRDAPLPAGLHDRGETAAALGVSPAKVKKDWTFAKAWLHRELGGGGGGDG